MSALTRLNLYGKAWASSQRAYLDSSQKRENGNMNAGTSGVNVQQPHTMEWRPSMGPAKMENLPYMGGPTTMVDYMSKQAMTGASPSPSFVQPGTKVQIGGVAGAGASAVKALAGAGGGTGGAGQQQMGYGENAAEAQKLLTQLQQIYDTPFQYNYATDPAYIAAQQATNDAADTAKDQTYADMADRGILNSSVTSEQIGSINTKAKQSVLQLIPGLESNAYNRYQQGVNNKANMIQTMLGQNNWQAGYDQNERWHQDDQVWKEGEMTGTVETPEYKALFDTLVGAKTGWHTAQTPQEKAAFVKQGADARAALAALTGRSPAEIENLFGSKVTASQALANYGAGGTQTLQAKRFGVEDKRYTDETAYNHEQDKQAQENWKADFGLREAEQRRLSAKGSGSGGGGPTFDQLLKGETNRMVTTMLSQISSVDEVDDWITTHMDDIMALGVNPKTFRDTAAAFFPVEKAGAGGLTRTEIYDKAIAAASKSDNWQKLTPDEQQAVVDKFVGIYTNLNNPPAAKVDPVDAFYNFFSKFIKPKPKSDPVYKGNNPAGYSGK